MSGPARAEVLQAFKQLHKTCKYVFNADKQTLTAARLKINNEFKKCKNVTEPNSINELIKFAKEVENEIRTTVIQAVETKPGIFTANIRPEIETHKNVMFDENVSVEQLRKLNPSRQSCCQDKK